MVLQQKPLFIISSPPCTAFSTLQNISKHKRDPEVVEAEKRAGIVHIKFCIELYKIQLQHHWYFIHEHPSGATSWQLPEIIAIMAEPSVGAALVDMCSYGMTALKNGKRGLVRKRTRLMSNSGEVLKRVATVCSNVGKEEHLKHEHVPLDQGSAKKAQVYPRGFVVNRYARESRHIRDWTNWGWKQCRY